jgi:hypothetical protein
MKINYTQLTACLFVLICTGLFIGLRLDAIWAGGNGIISLSGSVDVLMGQVDIQHDDDLLTLKDGEHVDTLARGEIVRTHEGTMAGMNLGDNIDVILDENTDLEIDQLSTSAIEITLHRGRLIVESDHQQLALNGKYSKWILEDGIISAVNYDFLETMLVVAAPDPDSAANAYLVWEDEKIMLTEPISVVETPPGSWEYTDFDFDLDFYNYIPPALQGMDN